MIMGRRNTRGSNSVQFLDTDSITDFSACTGKSRFSEDVSGEIKINVFS